MSETAGYFVWTKGLRGPSPLRIAGDMISYLSATLIIAKAPLTAAQMAEPLAALAEHYRHLLPKET